MAIKLMYITNEPAIAHIAEESGVDRIFIDLEVRGKEERQGHLDSVKSHHTLEDISNIKGTLTTSELLVRANALYSRSQEEINEIVSRVPTSWCSRCGLPSTMRAGSVTM